MGDLDLHFQGHLAILDLEYSQFAGCNAITQYFSDLDKICTEYASYMASNLINLLVTVTYIFKVIWPF